MKVFSKTIFYIFLVVLLSYCTTKKESIYSIQEANIKFSLVLVLKNLECNSTKQSNFFFFPVDKNQADLCIKDIYLSDCEKWNQNILPESCSFIGIQIK